MLYKAVYVIELINYFPILNDQSIRRLDDHKVGAKQTH